MANEMNSAKLREREKRPDSTTGSLAASILGQGEAGMTYLCAQKEFAQQILTKVESMRGTSMGPSADQRLLHAKECSQTRTRRAPSSHWGDHLVVP